MAPIGLFGVLVTILILVVSGPSWVKGQGPYPNTPCVDKGDCDPNTGATLLQCMGVDPDKKCSCPDGRLFHYNKNKCLIVATSACTSTTRPGDLTPNSECDPIAKKVMCQTGYSLTANKKCARRLFSTCKSNQDDCDHDLFATCRGINCQCPDGAIVEGDECKHDGASVCIPYDPVVPGPPQMPCRQGSDCEEKDSGSGEFRCTGCPLGMMENAKGNCVVPYEGPCIPGEASERPCDADAFFECDPFENKCLCQNPDQTWFDGASCKLLLGELCTDLTSTCSGDSCVTGQTCSCPAGTKPDLDNRKCLASYLEPCATDSECSVEEFLVCSAYTLKCDCRDNAWYDGASSSCKLLIGEPCYDYTPPCSGNACVTGQPCSCPDGKEPDSTNHKCLASYLDDCYVDSDCSASEFLVCSADLKCDCESNAWFDGASCKLLLGELCTDLTSTCSGDSCVTGQTCSCPAGTKPDLDNRKCLASYLEPCATDSECSVEEFLVCSAYTLKCDCRDNAWYDGASSSCKLLIGEPCYDYTPPCSGNACVTGQPCSCPDGKEPDSTNHKCLASYLDDCYVDSDCSASEFLVCSADLKCDCESNAWFDGASCKLLLGELCTDLTPTCSGDSCVTGQTCSCPAGTKPDLDNRKCLASYLEPCATDSECSVEEFLVCSAYTLKCDCRDNAWYDGASSSCKLLIGEPCYDYTPPCSGNACVTGQPCSCPDGKEPDSTNHKCLASYLDDCYVDSDCSASEFLVCSADLKCDCESNAWYNNDRCELLLDEPCAAGRYCIGTGDCGSSTNPCTCGSLSDEGVDKHTCIRHVGADCDDDQGRPCDVASNLVCGIVKKCACPLNTWYVNDQCELEIGQPCAEGKSCVGTGDCGASTDECTCGANAEKGPDDNHTCIRHHDAACDNDKNRVCNSQEYLFCDSSLTCACEANSWPKNGQCELLLGENCQPGRVCVGTGDCGASTEPCTCGNNAEEGIGRHTCVRHAGADCDWDRLCNDAEYLICAADGKCECAADSWYNPRSKLCELLQGEYCLSGSNSQPCTEFAMCSSQNQTCVCFPGYTPALNGTCILVNEPGEPSFGAPCEHVNDCSREDYLECGPDKTCECHFDSWFNPSSEKCELLVRSPCIPDSFAQACTEYADCTYNSNAGYICLCSEEGFVASTDKRCVHQSCGGYNRKLESFLMPNGHHKNDKLDPLYGTPCDHANDCSREDYLECGPDKTCECHFDSWFNLHSERCELLVRSPCIPDSFAQACTEYSECTYNTNAGFICLCNEDGFVGSADKRCVHQSCGGYNQKLGSFPMLNRH